MPDRTRSEFKKLLQERRGEATDILLQLLAIPSDNPPADTGTIAQKISASLQSAGDFEIQLLTVETADYQCRSYSAWTCPWPPSDFQWSPRYLRNWR